MQITSLLHDGEEEHGPLLALFKKLDLKLKSPLQYLQN